MVWDRPNVVKLIWLPSTSSCSNFRLYICDLDLLTLESSRNATCVVKPYAIKFEVGITVPKLRRLQFATHRQLNPNLYVGEVGVKTS